jgi:phosphomannomutase
MNKFAKKQLIVFDLDGTLAPSKSFIDQKMMKLILQLLEAKKVAVIGGGKYSQFQDQLLNRLPGRDVRLQNLFLFPTCASAFYRYRSAWKKIYAHKLNHATKVGIRQALQATLKDIDYIPPKKIYGPTLEDRDTQMSFSPLGQDIVTALGAKGIRMKEQWKKENDPLRFKIAKHLAKRLPELEVRVGGLTTIDITRKGIDKGYGVMQIKKILNIPIRDMVFIGDALYPGGNDHAAKKTGIQCISVDGPEDTKRIIEQIIAE